MGKGHIYKVMMIVFAKRKKSMLICMLLLTLFHIDTIMIHWSVVLHFLLLTFSVKLLLVFIVGITLNFTVLVLC